MANPPAPPATPAPPDSRYRRYEAAVDKALASFETIAEWADIIAFLTRLNRTLSAYPQYAAVPRRLLVAKRLAQCLNPNLPTGVHERTLETYAVVFQKVGAAGLAADLPVYGLGLLPFFEAASASVRGQVLDLIARYVVPLGDALRGALQPLVLALLPGLDDESAEYHGRTLRVLSALGAAVGEDDLCAAMWAALALSTRHRASSLAFFGRLFPRPVSSRDDALRLTAGRPDAASGSLALALDDAQPLVVRGALDAVAAHFPLAAPWLSAPAKTALVRAALLVLIRRDMSLSRRVYAWLSPDGPDADIPPAAAALVSAALRGLLESPSPEGLARPYRVLLHLNDRTAVVRPVLGGLVLPLVAALRALALRAPGSLERVLVSANQVFSVLDLGQIWGNLVRSAISASDRELDCHSTRSGDSLVIGGTTDRTAEIFTSDLVDSVAAAVSSRLSVSDESADSAGTHSPPEGDSDTALAVHKGASPALPDPQTNVRPATETFAEVAQTIAFGMEHLAICTDEAADSLIPLAAALLGAHFASRRAAAPGTLAALLRLLRAALGRVRVPEAAPARAADSPGAAPFGDAAARDLIGRLPSLAPQPWDARDLLSAALRHALAALALSLSSLTCDEGDAADALSAAGALLSAFCERFPGRGGAAAAVLLSPEAAALARAVQGLPGRASSLGLLDAAVSLLLLLFAHTAPMRDGPDSVVQPVVPAVVRAIWRLLCGAPQRAPRLASVLVAVYPHEPVAVDSFFASLVLPPVPGLCGGAGHPLYCDGPPASSGGIGWTERQSLNLSANGLSAPPGTAVLDRQTTDLSAIPPPAPTGTAMVDGIPVHLSASGLSAPTGTGIAGEQSRDLSAIPPPAPLGTDTADRQSTDLSAVPPPAQTNVAGTAAPTGTHAAHQSLPSPGSSPPCGSAKAVELVAELWSAAVEARGCPQPFMPVALAALLDAATDHFSPERARAASAWLARSVRLVDRIVAPAVDALGAAAASVRQPALTFVPFYGAPIDAHQAAYLLRQLGAVLDAMGAPGADAVGTHVLDAGISSRLTAALPQRFRAELLSDAPPVVAAALLALAQTFALAEAASAASADGVDAVQVAALALAGRVLDAWAGPSVPALASLVALLLAKAQYALQARVLEATPLVVRTLERALGRLAHLRGVPDAAALCRVVSEVLSAPAVPRAVVRAWTGLLVSSPAFLDDALPLLVEPQVRILVSRVRALAAMPESPPDSPPIAAASGALEQSGCVSNPTAKEKLAPAPPAISAATAEAAGRSDSRVVGEMSIGAVPKGRSDDRIAMHAGALDLPAGRDASKRQSAGSVKRSSSLGDIGAPTLADREKLAANSLSASQTEEAAVLAGEALADIFEVALGPPASADAPVRGLSRSGSAPLGAPAAPRSNAVTAHVPAFAAEVCRVCARRDARGAAALHAAAAAVYARGPLAVLGVVLDALASRLSESALVPVSPLAPLFCVRTSPLRADLLRNLSAVYRAARDPKTDAPSVDAAVAALYLACASLSSWAPGGRDAPSRIGSAMHAKSGSDGESSPPPRCASDNPVQSQFGNSDAMRARYSSHRDAMRAACGSGGDEADGAEMLAALLPAARDAAGGPPRMRGNAPLLLAAYCAVFGGALRGLSPERRRAMREHGDAVARLFETCVSMAAKAGDASAWAPSKSGSECADAESVVAAARDKAAGRAYAALLHGALPMLEALLGEAERVSAAVSALLGQLVVPGLRATQRGTLPGRLALEAVRVLGGQAGLVRFWRREFWDLVFMDAQLFSLPPGVFRAVAANMRVFLATDAAPAERIAEVVARIPSSASSNLFLSREMDATNRATMVRRLSLLLLVADAPHIKAALPGVQEKVVDVLRLGAGPAAAEVYLLLRVLLARLGDETPTTLWPVVVTEMLALYRSVLGAAAPGPGVLAAAVQASRLVDDVLAAASATPLLYVWALLGGAAGPGADLFSRLASHVRAPIGQPPDGVADAVRKRKPLVPPGAVSALADLGPFFRWSALRLHSPETLGPPRRHADLEDALLADMLLPIRVSDS